MSEGQCLIGWLAVVQAKLGAVKVNPVLVLGQIWPYALAVLLTFLVTLGCFPAITVRVSTIIIIINIWDWSDTKPLFCFSSTNEFLKMFYGRLHQLHCRVGALIGQYKKVDIGHLQPPIFL